MDPTLSKPKNESAPDLEARTLPNCAKPNRIQCHRLHLSRVAPLGSALMNDRNRSHTPSLPDLESRWTSAQEVLGAEARAAAAWRRADRGAAHTLSAGDMGAHRHSRLSEHVSLLPLRGIWAARYRARRRGAVIPADRRGCVARLFSARSGAGGTTWPSWTSTTGLKSGFRRKLTDEL